MSEDDHRAGDFTRRPPSSASIDWATAALGGGRLAGSERLTGGVCSAVHRLTVEHGGRRTDVVLRQYPAGLGLGGAVVQEADHLAVVASSGLPVPRVLAADAAGEQNGGCPSLLMTALPGRVELDPVDPGAWLTWIADLAARIHALDLPAPAFRPWEDSWIRPRDELSVPLGAEDAAVWEAAIAVLRQDPPGDADVFLHGDLLPVNLLWSQGRISGVTDWNSIHRGPRAVDVGQCRRYLAALVSPDWAEHLREAYESSTGLPLDPWWDLFALLHHDDEAGRWIHHQVAGRRPVDEVGMVARVEAVVAGTLARLD